MKDVKRILSDVLTDASDVIERGSNGDVSRFRQLAQKAVTDPRTGEDLARGLLCRLSHDSPLDIVAACLKVAGIDATAGGPMASFAKMLEERGEMMMRNTTAREIMDAGVRDYADQARKPKH